MLRREGARPRARSQAPAGAKAAEGHFRWAKIGFLGWWFLFGRAVRDPGSLARAQAKKRREREAQHGAAGRMVRCATCGVFLPRGDAVRIGETFRCNDPACLPK